MGMTRRFTNAVELGEELSENPAIWLSMIVV
jgi:hypothetical protein